MHYVPKTTSKLKKSTHDDEVTAIALLCKHTRPNTFGPDLSHSAISQDFLYHLFLISSDRSVYCLSSIINTVDTPNLDPD